MVDWDVKCETISQCKKIQASNSHENITLSSPEIFCLKRKSNTLVDISFSNFSHVNSNNVLKKNRGFKILKE